MTVDEVRAATAVLAAEITTLAQQFEAATGCSIHSIPVKSKSETGKPTACQVKVQV